MGHWDITPAGAFKYPEALEEELYGEFKYQMEQRRAQNVKIKPISDLDYILNEGSPSDYILFTKETKRILSNYLHNVLNIGFEVAGNIVTTEIPNDLFVTNAVPLPDFVFKLDVYDDEYKRITSSFYVRFIYSNGELVIAIAHSDGSVGALKTKQLDNEHYEIDDSFIYVDKNDDPIFNKPVYLNAFKIICAGLANHMLGEWYAVQIMLLNPVIKERIFEKSKKEKIRCKSDLILGNNSSKSNKRKAKYVKYKEFSSIILQSDIVRKKHTLCWYVIGHYRHYQNGSKTWVNGYWKGPLRELKKNLDEGRERILAQ